MALAILALAPWPIAIATGCNPRVPRSPPAATCTEEQRRNLLAEATPEDGEFRVTCSVTLAGTERITKRLNFRGAAASGVTFDCNGASIVYTAAAHGTERSSDNMLYVTSASDGDGGWLKPEDVTIRNCTIYGAVRVRGMDLGLLPAESRLEGYVRKVRHAAPTRITFDNLTIRHCGGPESCNSGGVGHSDNAFYLHQGIHHVTLQNSEISGTMRGVPVYLTTETYANVFRSNYFHARSTSGREQLSLDGSSYNRLLDNRFASLQDGGIYIYRNCGENGFVRHSKPSHNQIINNVFFYNNYTGPEASVLFGARGYKDYCPDDWDVRDRFPETSAADDRNYARHNIVMQNQIFKRTVADMIRTGHWPFDGLGADPTSAPNDVRFNETVTAETVRSVGNPARWPAAWSAGRTPELRRAGCYVESAYKDFFLDGQTVDVILAAGRPICSPLPNTCHDGDLARADAVTCSIQEVPFTCEGTTNDGCTRTATCPAGTRAVGAMAVCDLETGAVPETAIARRHGSISVMRASDNVAHGRCTVGSTTVSSGREQIRGIADTTSVSYGCSEHDANGGDCQIRGILYCR